MAQRRWTFSHDDGARHSIDWYDREDVVLTHGDRFFVNCEGGPCTSRLETFPPRVEIEEPDGPYVLVDGGPRTAWVYVFVSHAP